MTERDMSWPARLAIWFGMAFLMAFAMAVMKALGVSLDIAQFVNGSVMGLTGAWAIKLVQFR